jgi:Secretion system C-terminal sorting domain
MYLFSYLEWKSYLLNPQIKWLTHKNVRIQIFDVQGRNVAMVANEIYKTGSYKLNWNSNQLPSGLYFVNTEIGKISTTTKITKVK